MNHIKGGVKREEEATKYGPKNYQVSSADLADSINFHDFAAS